MTYGVWLLASTVLKRPVAFEENPHICNRTVPGSLTMSGQELTTWRIMCSACPPRRQP